MPVKLQCISADTPAKFFLLSSKGHTEYDSCLKYSIHGKYIKNRVCFPGISAHLKTAFKTMIIFCNLFHIWIWVLMLFQIICMLFVQELLKNYLIYGRLEIIIINLIRKVNKKSRTDWKNLINICIGLEFLRKPRSLQDLKYQEYKFPPFFIKN